MRGSACTPGTQLAVFLGCLPPPGRICQLRRGSICEERPTPRCASYSPALCDGVGNYRTCELQNCRHWVTWSHNSCCCVLSCSKLKICLLDLLLSSYNLQSKGLKTMSGNENSSSARGFFAGAFSGVAKVSSKQRFQRQ